jgi:S-adenosylmethionine hydrolase
MALLTLLTDFGLRDYYVAAVKGTVLRLARAATVEIVDLSHEVEPGDVAGAAFLLAAAAPAFPPGALHLAVVDPGVGGERRILALATPGARFVAPDNGLLTPFLDAGTAYSVERPDLYLPGPGSTFHGRDRFAPVAAALLGGETVSALGPPVADPRRLEEPRPRRSGRRLEGVVVHVDRFGNLVTNLPSSWLPPRFRAEVEGRAVELVADHYQLLPPGVPGLVPGSLGTLEVTLRGASLAERWGLGRGATLSIADAGD